MEQSSVWPAAAQMIRLHGAKAASRATLRAEELFAQDDIAGFDAWTRVRTAIDDLNRAPPTGNIVPIV